ncbi:ATP-binding protein [Marinoscillum sp.]|uniref:sensor histidine kinase n=1 Tax=Marinoscillum sp. TaxID=2024838 RepID=UPI003BAD791E
MKFVDLKIRNKLALVMILFALAVISLLSALYYIQFKEALKERVLLQLSSVKQLKVSQVRQRMEALVFDFLSNQVFTEQPDNADVLIAYGVISHDTVVSGYPLSYPEIVGSVAIQDLTPHDPAGQITLCLYKKEANEIRFGIFRPNIQSILMERTGLGETGESYLVGENMTMRSSSRFFPQRRPTDIVVKSQGVIDALEGEEGYGLINDYRGVTVFSAYERLDVFNLTWVILSEIDEQEALFPLKSLRTNLVIVLGIILIFVFIASYELARQLVKPVLITEEQLRKMSKGIFESTFDVVKREDEIGQMFSALERLIAALKQTVVFANEIGSGNFEARYDLLSSEDKLGAALMGMKERLRAYQVSEKRLKLENQRSLISGEEKERLRLSQELHDGLGPMLTILKIKVESSTIQADEKKELMRLFDETLGEMRKISNNLMPSVLRDFGAGEAIRNLLKQIGQDRLQVHYQYDPNGKINIPTNISIALYRVAQEAVNNVLKHARASVLNISLTEFTDRVSLYIQDNGQGFDPENVTLGNGLRNMRERINVENGIFELTSDSKGSVIEVEIPLV